VPPAGYEWVRDDDDALLVNTSTGEVPQVEYGVFA
jgi:Ni/Co efflux regulator RcnB